MGVFEAALIAARFLLGLVHATKELTEMSRLNAAEEKVNVIHMLPMSLYVHFFLIFHSVLLLVHMGYLVVPYSLCSKNVLDFTFQSQTSLT